jgi:hypothetical protein
MRIDGKDMACIGMIFTDTPLEASVEGRIFSGRRGRIDFLKGERIRLEMVKANIITSIRKAVPGLDDVALRWSNRCGCSMCPCSPGYNIYASFTDKTPEWVRWLPMHRDKYGRIVGCALRTGRVIFDGLKRRIENTKLLAAGAGPDSWRQAFAKGA